MGERLSLYDQAKTYIWDQSTQALYFQMIENGTPEPVVRQIMRLKDSLPLGVTIPGTDILFSDSIDLLIYGIARKHKLSPARHAKIMEMTKSTWQQASEYINGIVDRLT